jgi:hypothetical protein
MNSRDLFSGANGRRHQVLVCVSEAWAPNDLQLRKYFEKAAIEVAIVDNVAYPVDLHAKYSGALNDLSARIADLRTSIEAREERAANCRKVEWACNLAPGSLS